MMRPEVIAVSGVKNSGKTTVVQKLVEELTSRGLKVATIKHDGHEFEADRHGTDTFKHLAAGAIGAAVFDGEKFQVVKYAKVTEEHLISMFPEADLILLEGFKFSPWPKVEVVRGANSNAPVCDPSTLLAIVTDLTITIKDIPTFGLDDTKALAELLMQYMKRGTRI